MMKRMFGRFGAAPSAAVRELAGVKISASETRKKLCFMLMDLVLGFIGASNWTNMYIALNCLARPEWPGWPGRPSRLSGSAGVWRLAARFCGRNRELVGETPVPRGRPSAFGHTES